MLTSRSSSLSGVSSTSLGASLLRMVSKCVFHSCVCLSTLVITTRLHLSLECHCFKKNSS